MQDKEIEEEIYEHEVSSWKNFEKFCQDCDNFLTEHCPYLNEVNYDTDWEKFGCTNFDN